MKRRSMFVYVIAGDSAADVYGVTPEREPLTIPTFNNIREPADGILDLMVAVARAADWVILARSRCDVSGARISAQRSPSRARAR